MQKSIIQFGFMASIAMIISACQSPSNTQAIDKDAYLQQFIGQSSQNIRSRLNLKQLGYQTFDPPIFKDNQLTYNVQRQMTASLRKTRFPIAGTIPIPLQTNTPYNTDANAICTIQFQFQNNIAKSVSYQGPAC